MRAEDWNELLLEGRARIPTARFLVRLLSLAKLRATALAHGVKPKGFRVERANADQLAQAIVDSLEQNAPLRGDLAELLEASSTARPGAEGGRDEAASDVEARHVERLTELERAVERQRERAEREQTSAAKARRKSLEATRRRELAEQRLADLEGRVRSQERILETASAETRDLREILQHLKAESPERELSELRARHDELLERGAEERRRIAELSSKVRELEREVSELEELLPRGQRERLRQRRKSLEPPPNATLLPRLTVEFLRCLEDLENGQQRKIFASIARLVLSGFDYPGLHAKPLKGMDGLWSIRAGDHLRVYLRRLGDVIELVGAATREEQPTYLKKRRD